MSSVRRALAWCCLPVAAMASSAVAAPCAPSATIEGDPTLVDAVAPLLAARGIELHPPSNCPSAKVDLAGTGEALVVTIEDAYGRRSVRTVADATSAGTVVESWARQDANADLLAGFSDERTEAPPSAPIALAPGTVAAITVGPGDLRRPLVAFALAGESSLASDGAVSLGVRAVACVRVGPTCLGAMTRTHRGITDSSVRSLDLLATADVPLAVRRALLIPGVGIGMGWTAIAQLEGEDEQTTGLGARADLHLSVAVPLGQHVAFDAGISVDASLSSRGEQQEEGETRMVAPRGFVRGLIGLRIGGL